MASIRGWLTRFPFASDCRLAGSSPKTSQTAFSMSGSRTTRPLCRIMSASASSAIASEIGRPREWLVACKRHKAPESSRAWFVNREATNCCTSGGTCNFIRRAIWAMMPSRVA